MLQCPGNLSLLCFREKVVGSIGQNTPDPANCSEDTMNVSADKDARLLLLQDELRYTTYFFSPWLSSFPAASAGATKHAFETKAERWGLEKNGRSWPRIPTFSLFQICNAVLKFAWPYIHSFLFRPKRTCFAQAGNKSGSYRAFQRVTVPAVRALRDEREVKLQADVKMPRRQNARGVGGGGSSGGLQCSFFPSISAGKIAATSLDRKTNLGEKRN